MIGNRADSFLRLIRRSQRGKLKIYLGYCAGVGKTYQMLQDGHRLAAEGIDVVIGYVEPHGRAETQALTAGLEAVPRRKASYRGVDLEEMDLDAVLARRPAVVLVDELAHTNVPGGRNEKRYQDVEEILAAGIHVVSTLNIQHLESLYDMVEGAVGVKVRERVPDKIVLDADQIVNVDVTTEDLLKRLGEGKIYPRERISSALASFFRAENLEQLRELTLRELASQIDVRRRDPGHEESRSGLDQVLVCLGSRGPNSEALLRYGSRLAGRLNRNWYALYVQTPNENPELIDAQTQRILSNTLALARRLGATVFTYKGEDVVETILRFAREYRIGHVVIGRPHPISRMKRLLGRRDVAECLIRQARGLTVVVADNRVETIGTAGERSCRPGARGDGRRPAGVEVGLRAGFDPGRGLARADGQGGGLPQAAAAGAGRKPRCRRGRSLGCAAVAGSPGLHLPGRGSGLAARQDRGVGRADPGRGHGRKGNPRARDRPCRANRLPASVPVQPSDFHVRLLAELGAIARNDAFMQELAAAPNAHEIVERVRAALLGA